jgi:tRNA A37 threonylcarbamoyladenosine biosynthesis protein TsaE
MTNIHRVCSKSEDETKTLAAQMAGDILPVTVIALFGDLGTGKTIFLRDLLQG